VQHSAKGAAILQPGSKGRGSVENEACGLKGRDSEDGVELPHRIADYQPADF